MSGVVHVVGAGVAGLAAACALAEAGRRVVLHEAAKAAGGRARSYDDPGLGVRLDNGNHLLLSGNADAMVFLRRIGAERTLTGPAEAVFPFVDVATGAGWAVRPNRGRLPLWVFSRARRVPGTRAGDYLALAKLRRAGRDDLVAPLLGGAGRVYTHLLEPLAIAALNTLPDVAAAGPLAAVIAESLDQCGRASIPRWPAVGLSESFVDPALAYLAARGAEIRLGSRVEALDPDQQTVLAVPAPVAAGLIPRLTVPDEFEAICNLHFLHRLPPGAAGFWGFVNGTAEWAFAKGEVLSVTISAANRHADTPNETLAAAVWGELGRAFNLPAAVPPHRVLREKRATFACTPAQLARRPATTLPNPNWMLAGDFTETRLPATLEGAIRSGHRAALALLTKD